MDIRVFCLTHEGDIAFQCIPDFLKTVCRQALTGPVVEWQGWSSRDALLPLMPDSSPFDSIWPPQNLLSLPMSDLPALALAVSCWESGVRPEEVWKRRFPLQWQPHICPYNHRRRQAPFRPSLWQLIYAPCLCHLLHFCRL